MKKIYNVLFVIAVPVLFIFLTSETWKFEGSPGGRTGSPGDDGSTCTDCHTGTEINTEYLIYAPDLLIGGYSPGQTYEFFVIGLDPDASAFGFEATAEKSGGTKVGTFEEGFGGFTQTINNSKAITHTALGTVPLVDSGTIWMFSWTAPPTLEGEITFYTAVNAANGNMATSGDQIYTSSFPATPATGIANRLNNNALGIYPNPSDGVINLNIENGYNSERIDIIGLSGQVVHQQAISSGKSSIDLSHLEKGVYFVRVGDKQQRLIIR